MWLKTERPPSAVMSRLTTTWSRGVHHLWQNRGIRSIAGSRET